MFKMKTNHTVSRLLMLQLAAMLGASRFLGDARAASDEPCEPTTISSSNYFSRAASGVYVCTVRKNGNTVSAWMWRDNAALFPSERHRQKYEFRCDVRRMKRLEDQYSGPDEEDWERPQKDTTGDRWLSYICKNAKFY